MTTALDKRFIEQIRQLLSPGEAAQLLDSITNSEPSVSIRVNDCKGLDLPTGFERVPWCDQGYYLPSRPQFTFDPLFHSGCYYVQDASSMFIYHVLKSLVRGNVNYLDLCAAPGGKTTAVLQALPRGSVVVANDIVPQRAQVLKENIIKWGYDSCMVTNDSPKSIGALTHEFDIIAADVPCSGEGMFRKDDEAVAQWSPQLVAQCAARQRSILNDVWNALKPGGYFIYSTCTYNIDENENMVDYIVNHLGASVMDIPVDESWNIEGALTGSHRCYRFMPHRTRGEGLFMCILRKNCDAPLKTGAPGRPKNKKKGQGSIPNQVRDWLPQGYEFTEANGMVYATGNHVKEKLKCNYDKIKVIKPIGLEVGTIKGKSLIPSHQLAMSTAINALSFPKCDIDYPTAIAFLRGEAINIDAPRGYVLVTYRNNVMGFVNNLGNRANNLYPKPWRILSSHTPPAPSFL